jgi:hypothetical protein
MTTLLALAVTTTATMAIVSILLMCAKKKKRANKGKRKARKVSFIFWLLITLLRFICIATTSHSFQQARGKSKLVRDHKTVQPKNPSKGDVNVQMVTETDTGKTEKEVSLIAAPKKEEATQDLSKEQANTAMTSLMDVVSGTLFSSSLVVIFRPF